jgi:hypothetical protein
MVLAPVPVVLRSPAGGVQDRELGAVTDFFEKWKIVWRWFQILVGEGIRCRLRANRGLYLDSSLSIAIAWKPETIRRTKPRCQPLTR